LHPVAPAARVPAAVVPAATTGSDEPPPFNVPLTLLAEADGRTDILPGFHDLHGLHDGEAWYAYDLPSQGQWRGVAWQAGSPWPVSRPRSSRRPLRPATSRRRSTCRWPCWPRPTAGPTSSAGSTTSTGSTTARPGTPTTCRPRASGAWLRGRRATAGRQACPM